jgi:uncharacterized protein (TIGR02246 family)
MGVSRPQDINAAFAAAHDARDLDALLALYEPDALLAPQPGERVRGAEAIRAALAGLLALQGRMTSTNVACVETGVLALLEAEWELSADSVEEQGRSVEVVRRQADGSWRYVIDLPYGR